MNDPLWQQVDSYLGDRLAAGDELLTAILAANSRAGLPSIDVTPLQGKLLQLLAKSIQARRILEIGTLGGYSTVWLARALPPGGRVITLEVDPAHAAVAQANFERAGVSETVELRLGSAAETLPQLLAEGGGPFDLIFIDADKSNNPEYFQWALHLGRVGTLVIFDNVVRGGAVVNGDSDDPGVQGTRALLELLAAEPRVSATAIQTVGSKGHDGFAVAMIVDG
jgi:predicted O-methyltransferase YrrM